MRQQPWLKYEDGPQRSAIHVETLTYEASHGRKPRTIAGQASGWMFQLDGDDQNVVQIRGTYSEALRQAKKQAQYSVKVLP